MGEDTGEWRPHVRVAAQSADSIAQQIIILLEAVLQRGLHYRLETGQVAICKGYTKRHRERERAGVIIAAIERARDEQMGHDPIEPGGSFIRVSFVKSHSSFEKAVARVVLGAISLSE